MFSFDEKLILDEISFPHVRDELNTNEITVCYGTDNSFMIGAAISCSSIANHNKHVNISFHIFTDKIDDDFLKRFESFARKEKVTVTIHIIDVTELALLPKNKLWSAAIYYRFIIADYFYNKKDLVLYIDSDIVCIGDIEPVFLTNMTGNIVAAVRERDYVWWKKRADKLGVSGISEGYYNSGVLLINSQEWNKRDITNKAVKLLSDDDFISRLTYYDQDVLNVVTYGHTAFLDKKYNSQYSLNYELKEYHKRPILNEVILLHYVGPTKPWHSYASHYDIARPYRTVKEMSAWSEVLDELPKNSMQFRYAAKHMMKSQRIIKAVTYYFLYFKSKLIKSA